MKVIFSNGRIEINTDRCLFCNSKNIVKIDGLIICRNCGDAFPEYFEFENPKDCRRCGYQGDCLERFKFCPFDGRDVNKKLIEQWRGEGL